MRSVVITGGAGLVGSNVARACLAADPECTVHVLDLAPPHPMVTEYVTAGDADASARLRYAALDLTQPGALEAAVPDSGAVTHVVHAAAFCHVPEWERSQPERFFAVNVDGTRRVLEWARELPALKRLVHVSSGGVYGDPTAWSTPEPQDEDGPFNPPEIYAISKLAGEQLARRWGELFDLDVRVVRLSAVFGPMERVTAGRSLMSLPYAIARALGRDTPLVISARTLQAGGDWLSGVDAAGAVVGLLEGRLTHRAYNIAFGHFTPAQELLDVARELAPKLRCTVVDDAAAVTPEVGIDMDPDNRLARWNAYAIARVQQDTGWAPRPLGQQLAEYLTWAGEDPLRRAP